MQKSFWVFSLSACVLAAQTTNFSGVWKANLEKSKLGGFPGGPGGGPGGGAGPGGPGGPGRGPGGPGGPGGGPGGPGARPGGFGPTSILWIVEQQGSKITERAGQYSARGEYRSTQTFDAEGKPTLNSNRGLPMQTKASWDAGKLVLDSQVAGPRPLRVHETWSLAPDGNTLTIDTVNSVNGRELKQLLVLEKQPDAAGEPLRQPEQKASERYKNVKIMKDLTASAFIDAMRAFTMSLGVNCEHCHVQGKDELDDKKEKLTARKMITMTRDINQQSFEGKAEVRCYTCHQGKKEPLKSPAFSD